MTFATSLFQRCAKPAPTLCQSARWYTVESRSCQSRDVGWDTPSLISIKAAECFWDVITCLAVTQAWRACAPGPTHMACSPGMRSGLDRAMPPKVEWSSLRRSSGGNACASVVIGLSLRRCSSTHQVVTVPSGLHASLLTFASCRQPSSRREDPRGLSTCLAVIQARRACAPGPTHMACSPGMRFGLDRAMLAKVERSSLRCSSGGNTCASVVIGLSCRPLNTPFRESLVSVASVVHTGLWVAAAPHVSALMRSGPAVSATAVLGSGVPPNWCLHEHHIEIHILLRVRAHQSRRWLGLLAFVTPQALTRRLDHLAPLERDCYDCDGDHHSHHGGEHNRASWI